MATGKIMFFNEVKGFGFIKPDDGSIDVFCHISALRQIGLENIAEGTVVEYDVVMGAGRPAAKILKVEQKD